MGNTPDGSTSSPVDVPGVPSLPGHARSSMETGAALHRPVDGAPTAEALLNSAVDRSSSPGKAAPGSAVPAAERKVHCPTELGDSPPKAEGAMAQEERSPAEEWDVLAEPDTGGQPPAEDGPPNAEDASEAHEDAGPEPPGTDRISTGQPGLDEVLRWRTDAPGGTLYLRPHEGLYDVLVRLPATPDENMIVIHGHEGYGPVVEMDSDAGPEGRVYLNARDLAVLTKADPHWSPRVTLVVACNLDKPPASGGDSFAQKFADELDVPVEVADEYAWGGLGEDGRTFVVWSSTTTTIPDHTSPGEAITSADSTPQDPNGTFVTYYPTRWGLPPTVSPGVKTYELSTPWVFADESDDAAGGSSGDHQVLEPAAGPE